MDTTLGPEAMAVRRAELEACTPAHLRAIAIRAGRPLATPRTAAARRAAIEVILSAETGGPPHEHVWRAVSIDWRPDREGNSIVDVMLACRECTATRTTSYPAIS